MTINIFGTIIVAACLLLSASMPANAASLEDFIFGGTAPWFVQSAVNHDGVDAYQSGAISHSQSSWMENTVTGPGAVRFWWKVSSESCCDPLTFSVDGVSQANIRGAIDWQSKAFAVSAGSHALRWTYSTDSSVLTGSNAGWVDQVTFEEGSNIDVTPPATTASPAGGTVATTQTVSLTANEPATIYFTTNGSEPTTASTQYTSALTINSTTTLKFFAADASGNVELTNLASYYFDTTPPSTSISLAGGTYSGTRDVSLYCSDSGMGCSSTYYCFGSGCSPSTLYSSVIAITSSTNLRYYSVDRGGNNEPVKTTVFTITPDVTAPTTTTNYANGTYSPMSVYLFCNDGDGSGCDATYYCLGAGCTPSTSFSGSIYINTSTDLRFYSVDRPGNSEPVKTSSYTIDATPPTTTPSVAGGIYATPQNITLSCSDGTGSSCSIINYCLGKGCYPNTQYTGPINITSSTYLRYFSFDAVYNQEDAKTERYTILSTPPSTINVPADRATIQGAIDATHDGDTILVAPGTYVENIDFKGKVITVISSGGPVVTIIDGNQAGPVVSFISDEGLTSILDGFTIRNGKTGFEMPSFGYGGGILINGSSPLIRNNSIINNYGCVGVGISVRNGAPLVQGNLIANNTQVGCTTGEGGGGIYLGWSPGTQLIDNTITGNSVPGGHGGGIFLNGSGKTLIRGNIIRGNSTAENASPCSYGGGISMINGNDPLIVQNLIVDNRAGCGSGVYWSGANAPYLVNNSIVDNVNSSGSVVNVEGYTQMINNIVFAKSGATPIYCQNLITLNPPDFSHNLVYTQSGSSYGGLCTDQNGINGNITADPRLNSTAFGYYGLRPDSPAIEAGDNSAPSLPATDLNGAPRLIAGTPQGAVRVDIGAYEYDPDEPRAVVTDPPASATRETAASITVSGTDIVSYRYALDGGPFTTADTPVATPIALTGLTGGRHAVAVIGKTLTREQLVSSATVAEWTIDTAPPVTTATPASGIYTAAQSVTLACNDGSGSGCAGTMYCLGSDCTPNTPYSGPIAITASTGLRYFSQDAFGFQEAVKTASYNFTSTISGRVTDSGTGAGIQGVSVTAYSATTGSYLGYGYTDSSGAYQVAGLQTGNYKLQFSAYNYVEQWYGGKADRAAATAVALSAPGAITGIDVILVKGGSITGIVSDSTTGTGIQEVYVYAYHAVTGASVGSGYSDSSGNYSVSGLASGDYKLSFQSFSNAGYLRQWYSNKADQSSALPVSVTAPNTTSGINVALVKGGSITGTVTDSVSGAAIASVYVTAIDAASGDWIYSVNTDSSGVYSFVGLSGSYKLRFSANDYVEQWYSGKANQSAASSVSVTAPNTTAGINLVMVKGGSITGLVLDSASGTGIQGAFVSAYNAVTGSWAGSGSTDSSGFYRITGLVAGIYKLRFSAYSYAERWSGNKADQETADTVAVTAPNTTAGINIGLIKGAVISGTVTDKDTGTGIQGVYVTAYNATNGSWVGSGYTDSAGAYSIFGLASGSYKLQFYSLFTTGYLVQWYSNSDQKSTANIVAVTAPNTVSGIDVIMGKGAVITGTVTDLNSGNGIQNINVTAYNAAGSWAGSVYTDSSGTYSVTGLTTGNYKLEFSGAGYVNQWYDGKADQITATPVSATVPNTVSSINMSMVRGGSISGIITDRNTGAGVAGAYLYVINRSTGDWAGSAYTDSAGSYSISGLASGTYRLRIEPSSGRGYLGIWYGGQDGYQCANVITVSAPDATSGIDVSLDMGGSISGRVTDASSGAGLSGVSISLMNNSTHTGTIVSSSLIDSTGAYTIGGLSSGEYALTFSAPGYVRTNIPIVVNMAAPNVISGADAALIKGGSISGRVTDSDTSAGIGDVWVEALDSGTDVWLGGDISDINGDYQITGLPSGSYKLRFNGRDSGYADGWYSDQPGSSVATSVIVAAPAATAGINVTLARMGAISGLVTDSASAEPLNWIAVTAYDVVTGALSGSALTNTDGTYTLSGLPTGSYRIKFTGTSSANGSYLGTWYGSGTAANVAAAVAVLSPATTSAIDVQLIKGGAIAGSIIANVCPGPRQVNIRVYDAAGVNLVGQTWVDTNYTERFTIGALSAGNYKLAIIPGEAGFVRQWYPSRADAASAEPVTVTAGATTGGIQIQLATGGGSIAGRVTVNIPLSAAVKIYDWHSGGLVAETMTSFDGRYQVNGLPDGSYKLLFSVNHTDRWYRTANETAQASPVVVSSGAAVTGIDLAAAEAPAVTTGAAAAISPTGATLYGTVNDNLATTAVTFQYGQTTDYISSASGGLVTAGSGTTAVYSTISGLACGTNYHFRVAGVNSAGTTYGADQSFITAACPVNGACGSSNGGTFTAIPSIGLCIGGTPSAVTGSGPWSWSCTGANGGTNAGCIAAIDATGPAITISTLPDGAITNNATLNVSGTVADISGVADLMINNTVVTVNNGSFSHAVTLVSGVNTIRMIANDTLGNSSTITRTVTLDQAAPLLTISAPVDNSKTAQVLATITGTIDETSSVTVKVNSGTSQNAAITGNSYSATVTLVAGLNTVTITATDLAGNTASAVRSMTYDNTSPSIAITIPNQDISTAQNSIIITGTVSDTLTSTTVRIAFNSQNYSPVITDGTFSQLLTIPAVGTYSIIATATDGAGNSSSATRNLVYQKCGIVVPSPGKTRPSLADAMRVLNIAMGGITPTAADYAQGDIAPLDRSGRPKGDGVIDTYDAIGILRMVAGLL